MSDVNRLSQSTNLEIGMQEDGPAALFFSAVLSLVETEGLREENRLIIRERLQRVTSTITLDPRQRTEANVELLFCLGWLLFARAESLYGDGSHELDKLDFIPYFLGRPSSQICPKVNKPDNFVVTIAAHATTWEDVFYEVAHEMVHFLNPVAGVHEKQLAALEEGVAVKFAETTYRELISTYTGGPPKISPVTLPDGRYYPAFKAANKLSDALLATIREHFGSFSDINDAVAFGAMTSEYLEQHEIELLIAPFSYPAPDAFA